MPPDQPSFSVDIQFSETRHIEQTLLNSKQIIANYFKREQEFSRFASHELRTPIMVNLIKNAFSYSVGDIDIDLNRIRLSITNLHQGNEIYNEGYGCGTDLRTYGMDCGTDG